MYIQEYIYIGIYPNPGEDLGLGYIYICIYIYTYVYTSSWDVGTCGKARSIYKGKVSPTTYGGVSAEGLC